MNLTVDQVKSYGVVPYAVYGGIVYSFKLRASDERAYDIADLFKVLNKNEGR